MTPDLRYVFLAAWPLAFKAFWHLYAVPMFWVFDISPVPEKLAFFLQYFGLTMSWGCVVLFLFLDGEPIRFRLWTRARANKEESR